MTKKKTKYKFIGKPRYALEMIERVLKAWRGQ